MTVLNAVALAGGFTYRAKQSDFLLSAAAATPRPAEWAVTRP